MTPGRLSPIYLAQGQRQGSRSRDLANSLHFLPWSLLLYLFPQRVTSDPTIGRSNNSKLILASSVATSSFVFRIELWGEDPWVPIDRPLVETTRAETEPKYLAQNLKPYTRYRLKVFLRNSDDSYNVQVRSWATVLAARSRRRFHCQLRIAFSKRTFSTFAKIFFLKIRFLKV